jgi:DNA repair exonuclease SbcCD ATPase subunit
MKQELENTASEYLEVQEEIEEKQRELNEKKEETFGTKSEEGEDLAREFFSDVGMDTGSKKTDEVDELEETVSELEQKFNEIEKDFYKLLTGVKFPLDENIEDKDGEVVFPFFEEIDERTIEGMEQLIDINKNGVELRTDSIVANYSEVEEAIEEVKNWTEKIRESSRRQLNIDEYVSELKNRDEKIQAMLCVLYEEDQPMAKKDLEMAVGVEKGGLRGVLYHVLDNDPYLQKTDNGYKLSKTGRT